MKEINSIILLISEFLKNAYESKKAKLLVNKSSEFINRYKQDKIKIVEIRRDLNKKKLPY